MFLKFGAKEQFVGVFLVITLFILIGAIVFIAQGKNWFKKHERYHTFFEEGYNLSPGSKVTLYHTKIGKVVKVRLTEDNRVRVDLKILAKYASRIREDTVATVESPTIIGSEYIAIVPGTMQRPLLPPGGEIISTEKKALSDYMKEFKVEEKLGILTDIMKNIKEITDRIKDPEGSLFGTLDNIKEITDRLKDPEGQIFTSLDNIRQITEQLKDPEGQIFTSLDNILHITDRLKDPKGELFQTLDNLVSISQKIKKGEGSVGKLLIKDDLYLKIEKEINKVDSVLGNIELITVKIPAIVDEAEKRLKEIKKPLTDLDKILKDVPEIMNTVKRELDEISDILDSVKENFLIKRNLPPSVKERSISLEGRGE
jgi:phospholipid/cholesterol/gamma-HCH transport system substrate-binding protein